ncbi:MAG: Na+/H+ antiporter NhaA [Thermoleophilaceae bacterium]
MSATAPDPTRQDQSHGRAFGLPPALADFLRTESGSAVVLLGATLLALTWANSPLSDSYDSLWSTELAVSLGESDLSLDLRHWVNDGLMVFFFFVIGLEVRRELTVGELTERQRVRLAVLAAAAGLAVPAVIYLAINAGGPGADGFGIAMATDTAFMLGALALVGPGCPTQLRVFLLSVAVFDDIGAIAVVAIFYTESLELLPAMLALGFLGAILVLRRLQVWRAPAYFVVGLGLWVATVESGVHPTIAGIVLGLLAPAYLPSPERVERAASLARAFRQSPTPGLARSTKLSIEAAVSSNERLQELLHPWTGYVVVPLFAVANAGIALDGDTITRALASSVTLGVFAGLVAGKLIGIGGASWAAIRSGWGTLPRGVRTGQLAGAGAISGIGFTVSLFIVDLAFSDSPELREEAKIGVLAAAVVSVALAFALFRLARVMGHGQAGLPRVLDRAVDPERDHIQGPPGAPLTLVEYGDFECPYCGQATGVVAELRERFGDELRYVFRHLPLTDVHPHAEMAAEAAEAAAAQGRFWDMHDRLFSQDALEADDIVGYAAELGLDLDSFAEDVRGGVHRERVREDAASAEASGATGTPTFFVGDRRVIGPWDAATLAAALERGRR